jgi:hypothetical protein
LSEPLFEKAAPDFYVIILSDMTDNKKQFGKIGLTPDTRESLEIFIDGVYIKEFSIELRKLFLHSMVGQIENGWCYEETDLDMLKGLIKLFELLDTLEREYDWD